MEFNKKGSRHTLYLFQHTVIRVCSIMFSMDLTSFLKMFAKDQIHCRTGDAVWITFLMFLSIFRTFVFVSLFELQVFWDFRVSCSPGDLAEFSLHNQSGKRLGIPSNLGGFQSCIGTKMREEDAVWWIILAGAPLHRHHSLLFTGLLTMQPRCRSMALRQRDIRGTTGGPSVALKGTAAIQYRAVVIIWSSL